MRDFAIAIMARFHKNELRATRASYVRGECRANTKRAGLIVSGTDYAPLSVAVANRNRFSGERRIVADLYRRKEGVEVNVKDASRRGRARCGQLFLLSATLLASSLVLQ
jgi:hypothetical protein